MKKTINIFIVILVLGLTLGVASAIYPGECDSFNFSKEGIVTWNVEGNSTPLNGFTYTSNGTKVEYCFSGDFVPDTFTLTFYNEEEVVIIPSTPSSSSGGGGGSSSSSYNRVYVVDEVSGKDYGEVSKYPRYNTEEILEEEVQEESVLETTVKEEERKPYWRVGLLIAMVLLMMFLLFKLIKSKSNSLKEEHTIKKEELKTENG